MALQNCVQRFLISDNIYTAATLIILLCNSIGCLWLMHLKICESLSDFFRGILDQWQIRKIPCMFNMVPIQSFAQISYSKSNFSIVTTHSNSIFFKVEIFAYIMTRILKKLLKYKTISELPKNHNKKIRTSYNQIFTTLNEQKFTAFQGTYIHY